VLESILDDTKPIIPEDCRHLDYLLATPFRYGAAYPHGSRFRRAGKTLGVYYAAEAVETAVAEMVFYRFLFFAESPGTPWPDDAAEYTAFSAALVTELALDLTLPPLDRDAASWMSLTDYAACQALADLARSASIQLLRYRSVRDPRSGMNVAVLSCAAFVEPGPLSRQTWRIRIGANGAQALCEHPRAGLEFAPQQFADDPRIAGLNWVRPTRG
jgi:hypothetical protein